MTICSLSLSKRQVAMAERFGGICVVVGTVITVAATPLAEQLQTRAIYLIEPGIALACVGLVVAVAANQFRVDLEG